MLQTSLGRKNRRKCWMNTLSNTGNGLVWMTLVKEIYTREHLILVYFYQIQFNTKGLCGVGWYFPVGIYLFKVNSGNTRTMCENLSNLIIKTPGRCQWRCCSGVYIVDFEQINAGWFMKPVLKNYSKFGYESRFWRSQIYVDSKSGSITCL